MFTTGTGAEPSARTPSLIIGLKRIIHSLLLRRERLGERHPAVTMGGSMVNAPIPELHLRLRELGGDALELAERGALRGLLQDPDLFLTLETPLLRIAEEVASGLHYLHTRRPRVLH